MTRATRRRHRRPRRARLRPRDPADADAATSRPGMLGLGLCALMASFMSGMAGNTTAFNTVWTYDIYQSYIKPGAVRRALPRDGARGNGLRHPDFSGGRVRRATVQQHHGPAAAGVRVRERAAVRDVHAGHVLEAHDGPRRVHGPAHRHAGGGAAPRTDAAGRRRGQASRAAASARWCTRIRARWRRTSGRPSSRGRRASS